jgi:hypothetical protein
VSLSFGADGWLPAGPGVVPVPTVRTCRLEVDLPLAVVWHGTGGACRPGYGERLARRIQTYRRGVDRPASWHLLVARDGTIYQSAPLSVGTWHVGRPGQLGGRAFRNINAATVGVELENAGRLARLDGRLYCWPYHRDPAAPRHERRRDPRCEVAPRDSVRLSDGAVFAAFTPAQESAATQLLEALAAALERPRAACAYTHRQFDPDRKTDPGRLFEELVLPRMLDLVFGPDDDATEVSPPPDFGELRAC